eukprot:5390906-Pleurochrysis_carterae.AAC.1
MSNPATRSSKSAPGRGPDHAREFFSTASVTSAAVPPRTAKAPRSTDVDGRAACRVALQVGAQRADLEFVGLVEAKGWWCA